MSKKSLFKTLSLLAFTTVCMSIAHADQEQSAGGVGVDCQSGSVACASGRTISCNATVGDLSNRSYCMQRTGDVGLVKCEVFDSQGHRLVRSEDRCP